ncbi:MAG: hypothetical protein EXS36_12605 [Pedosphaera sp.]|nr:hypothetical protein [Pedosphaera sp.]
MSTVTAPPPTLAIWERARWTARKSLDAGAARALLGVKLIKRDLDRADEPAACSAMGGLTKAKSEELESYRTVGTALEFLKSEARCSLSAAV